MQSKTFCILPWYSVENFGNNNSACCLLPPGHNIEQIKRDLSQGIRSSACQMCWRIEDQGKDSRRIQENRFLDYKLNQDIELIEQECYHSQVEPLLYQVFLSNLCNQACVTCGSAASTKWAEIERKMNIVPKSLRERKLNDLDINFATAKRIGIIGGEPLFDPTTYQLLEQLKEHNNTDCFISLITNGSIWLDDKKLEFLKNFTDLNICISIDGINSRFEYMRWPGKWNRLLENIEQYQKICQGNISISYTISSVNAIYHNETIEWFETQGLKYNINLVDTPALFNVEHMPAVIKQQLQGHAFFGQLVKINGNELSSKLLLDKLQSQDQAKRINIKDYMPELYELLATNIIANQ